MRLFHVLQFIKKNASYDDLCIIKEEIDDIFDEDENMFHYFQEDDIPLC